MFHAARVIIDSFVVRVAVVCVGLAAVPAVALGQGGPRPSSVDTLKTLSLQELADLEVTVVSRNGQRARDAAAAVYVITEEDIRRSGARSLPEALRLAPNVQVARATSRSWAVSARGFAAPFSNKLLVLIDGRTVYSPLFSGVFWDVQDTLIEDIDRIEVISGPGASVWGANAVNGVINVITKNASDSLGGIASVGAGTEERFLSGARFGGSIGSDAQYRLYGKYFNRADSILPTGDDAGDGWRAGQGGGRIDWNPTRTDIVTLQWDAYRMSGDQLEAADVLQSGGNLLTRWTRALDANESLHMQMYYDRVRQFTPDEFGDTLDTIDLDTQYERDMGTHHHLMVGGGYRFTHDVVENLPGSIAFLPPRLDRHLFSAFVQDEVDVPGDRVRLTVGTKFERNDYTGLEVQPTARVAVAHGPHMFWGAVSRAVRTPSRFDRDLFFPSTPPFVFAGGPEFGAETLVASEGGWKATGGDVLASVAIFVNAYDDIRSTSPGPPFVTQNNVEGSISGAELTVTWQPTIPWRLTSGYTLLREDLRVKPGQADLNAGQGETFDPEHQFQIRSWLQLHRRVEFDVWVRHVGAVAGNARSFPRVPSYVAVDARIGWSRRGLELSIVGQNLFDDRHAEFGSREFRRAAHAKALWRFW
jgi:iron complex outermembrane recepter protein